MNVLVDAPVRESNRVRPRMRSVGVAHGVASLALLGVLAFGSLDGCDGVPVRVIPGALELALFVALASVAMIARLPRMSAIAPALSLGASLPLLGGAVAGWMWVSAQPCMGNVLDREVVTLHIVTAASAAVLVTSLWLLLSRDEVEPWYAARGVAVSAAGAATVLVLGVGFIVILHERSPFAATTFAITVPWAIVVAMTGWLRPSPAVALAVPAVCQALWLLLR
ncbi:MAG: hypothetical protein ACJ73J_03200 [Actinomycetes bacterium]